MRLLLLEAAGPTIKDLVDPPHLLFRGKVLIMHNLLDLSLLLLWYIDGLGRTPNSGLFLGILAR